MRFAAIAILAAGMVTLAACETPTASVQRSTPTGIDATGSAGAAGGAARPVPGTGNLSTTRTY